MNNDENIENTIEAGSDEMIPNGSLWDDVNSEVSTDMDNPFDTTQDTDNTDIKQDIDNTTTDSNSDFDGTPDGNVSDFDNSMFDDYGTTFADDGQNIEENKMDENREEIADDANVSIIINKIDDLVAKYDSLKDENQVLQNDIVNAKIKIELAEKNIQSLEEEVSCKELEIQSILKKVTNLDI